MPEINLDDTIAAIATPVGEGGISVIRLSGPQSFDILEKIFRPKSGRLKDFLSHTIHYGNVLEPEGKMVDQALVSIFRNPHSYTGQDVLEMSLHGGLIVTRHILNLLIKMGARHAEPGEFTKRAFLNGKIDLTQAEAVLDLIRAKSEKSMETAIRQLSGSLSHKFKALKEELMKMYAHMEAFLDFPEEHLEIYEDKVFLEKFSRVHKDLAQLVAGFKRGALLKEGGVVAIVGKPNVGKSSLFNALLSRDRALVSEYPGTTRDVLEEAIEINGIYLRLLDTAGLSQELEKTNPLERMGMEKTREMLKNADCFLFLADASKPLDLNDEKAYQEILKNLSAGKTERPILGILNKIDLPIKVQAADLNKFVTAKNILKVSTKTKSGLEELEKELGSIFAVNVTEEQITRLRHRNALEESSEALLRAQAAFQNRESLEYVIVDLKKAIDSLRELMGEVYSEDLLDVIFSEFCIGK